MLSTSREEGADAGRSANKVAKSFGSFGTKPGRFCLLCISSSPLLSDVLNEQARDLSRAILSRRSQRSCLCSRNSCLFPVKEAKYTYRGSRKCLPPPRRSRCVALTDEHFTYVGPGSWRARSTEERRLALASASLRPYSSPPPPLALTFRLVSEKPRSLAAVEKLRNSLGVELLHSLAATLWIAWTPPPAGLPQTKPHGRLTADGPPGERREGKRGQK